MTTFWGEEIQPCQSSNTNWGAVAEEWMAIMALPNFKVGRMLPTECDKWKLTHLEGQRSSRWQTLAKLRQERRHNWSTGRRLWSHDLIPRRFRNQTVINYYYVIILLVGLIEVVWKAEYRVGHRGCMIILTKVKHTRPLVVVGSFLSNCMCFCSCWYSVNAKSF